jgi:hypothetical protein
MCGGVRRSSGTDLDKQGAAAANHERSGEARLNIIGISGVENASTFKRSEWPGRSEREYRVIQARTPRPAWWSMERSSPPAPKSASTIRSTAGTSPPAPSGIACGRAGWRSTTSTDSRTRSTTRRTRPFQREPRFIRIGALLFESSERRGHDDRVPQRVGRRVDHEPHQGFNRRGWFEIWSGGTRGYRSRSSARRAQHGHRDKA